MQKSVTFYFAIILVLFLAACSQAPVDLGTEAGMVNNYQFFNSATYGTTNGRNANWTNHTTSALNVGSASQLTVVINCTSFNATAPVLFSPIRFQYSIDNFHWFNSTNTAACLNNNSITPITDSGVNYIRLVILSNSSLVLQNSSFAAVIAAR